MTDRTPRDASHTNQAGSVKHTLNKALDTAGGLLGQASASTASTAPDFVESAVISDRYEIESSRVALDRTHSRTVREAAQTMIDDHTDTSAKLETAVQQSPKVGDDAMPAQLDRRRQTMIEHLREAPEDEFDRTWLKQQVMAHEEATKLLNSYRDEGDCQVLRSFAVEVAPVIDGHLNHVKRLETNLLG